MLSDAGQSHTRNEQYQRASVPDLVDVADSACPGPVRWSYTHNNSNHRVPTARTELPCRVSRALAPHHSQEGIPMRLSPAAAGGVEVTGALIVGLLPTGPAGSVAAATPGAGSGPNGPSSWYGDRPAYPRRLPGHPELAEPACVRDQPCLRRPLCRDDRQRPEHVLPGRGHRRPCVARSPPASTERDGTRIRCGTVVNRNGFGIAVQIGGNGAPRCARGPGRPVRRRAVRAAAASG